MKLLTYSSYKVKKTNIYNNNYLLAIMYLAPHKISGKNLCPHASVGCSTSCLFSSGFGRYTYIRKARIKKTQLFLSNRKLFKEYLWKDIHSVIRKAGNKTPAIRLNGTSDIAWEKIFPDLYTSFPAVVFYDYTKSINRYNKYLDKQLPSNYHLIFSRSEKNENDCLDILKRGGSVSVVFRQLPSKWNGFKVVNGDHHDLRFLDAKPKTVIGLLPKGKAKQDSTGFVI